MTVVFFGLEIQLKPLHVGLVQEVNVLAAMYVSGATKHNVALKSRWL
jgi:hypothetical protein